MAERMTMLAPPLNGRTELKAYAADLAFGSLAVGVDNIHHDVYLSPQWTEQTRLYILERVRQATKLNLAVEKDPRRGHGKPKVLDTGAWRRQLLELLQGGLTRARRRSRLTSCCASRSSST